MKSGVSILAKSLFARKPRQTSKTNIISDGILSKGFNNSYEKGNTKAHFDTLQKTFMAPKHNGSINIGLSIILTELIFLFPIILSKHLRLCNMETEMMD